MQGGLSSADRKLLAGASAVAAILVIAALVLAPAPEDANAVPSTYATGSGGARAAYLLLAESGYDVTQWEEAPAALPNPGKGTLLILADPSDAPSTQDVRALHRFVNSGGRVLFSGPSIERYFTAANVEPEAENVDWREYPAAFPSYITRGAATIVMQAKAKWGDLAPTQLPLYGKDSAPVVVDWRIGDGELLWWAEATPLTNAGIVRSGNLNFFLNSVGAPGSPSTEKILWDEYFHGQRRSLWNYFAATPLKWGLVQLLLLGFALVFTFSRRRGPIVPAPVVSRLSPLEFVDTMGGLYQRAGAASVPVSVSYRRLRFDLARRLALPVSTRDAELARAAAARLGLPLGELESTLQNANSAEHGKLTPRAALQLVSTMEQYARRIRAPKPVQESID